MIKNILLSGLFFLIVERGIFINNVALTLTTTTDAIATATTTNQTIVTSFLGSHGLGGGGAKVGVGFRLDNFSLNATC